MNDTIFSGIIILCIIGIISVTFLLISHTAFTIKEDKQHQINFSRIAITHMPVSNPINETSLVSSTQSFQGYTLLHLSNEMIINQTNGSIKAGQSINISYILYQPICSYKIITNGTIYNGTLDDLVSANKYHFTKTANDECDNMQKSMQVIGWSISK